MPDRTQQIEAALLDIRSHPRVSAVKMADGAVVVPSEDANRRILTPVGIFAGQIVLERAGAGAQEPQSVPSPFAGMRAQGRRIGRGNNREVDVLGQVMSNAIQAVDQRGAHWARA